MADKDKIADEVMSDEELDKIAGGNKTQSLEDSRFLNSLNGSCPRYHEIDFHYHNPDFYRNIAAGWKSVGITFYPKEKLSKSNRYYLDGKRITQEEARQHAMNVTGRQLNELEWKIL